MERISSPLAEFVKVGSHYCQAVPTKRASALCVEKGFGYQKLQANVCLDVLTFRVFRMILLFALNFQGIT